MPKIIPKYDDYELIGRTRLDATIALANSNPHLIARGLIDGTNVVHKFGAASDVGLSLVPVTTSQTYPTPVTAESLEVLSDSTNDNGTTSPLGSGALIIRIFGLKTWAGESTEDVTLNGTTVVAIPGTWLRIYRVKVIGSGTYATDLAPSHSSTITIRGAGAGATWAIVDAQASFGLGQSEIAAYSVPTGKLAYVHSAAIFVEANKSADVLFFVREDADIVAAPYSVMQSKIILRNIVDALGVSPDTPLGAFTGPCDIGWLGAATAQTANISIDFEIELHDV